MKSYCTTFGTHVGKQVTFESVFLILTRSSNYILHLLVEFNLLKPTCYVMHQQA
jgi:hypothetical protein